MAAVASLSRLISSNIAAFRRVAPRRVNLTPEMRIDPRFKRDQLAMQVSYPWGGLSLSFRGEAPECSAIHFAASRSVTKPLIASVSPSGQRTSTPHPLPGFFRTRNVGCCSNICSLCAAGRQLQASYPVASVRKEARQHKLPWILSAYGIRTARINTRKSGNWAIGVVEPNDRCAFCPCPDSPSRIANGCVSNDNT